MIDFKTLLLTSFLLLLAVVLLAGCRVPGTGRAPSEEEASLTPVVPVETTLTIKTNVPNAHVYIRWWPTKPWLLLGTTPLEKVPLLPDKSATEFGLKVEKPGYESLEFQRVRMNRDQEMLFNFDMARSTVVSAKGS